MANVVFSSLILFTLMMEAMLLPKCWFLQEKHVVKSASLASYC
jgi:hypothetical protein